jgi:hypothetical protein
MMHAAQLQPYVNTITEKVVSIAKTTLERTALFYINTCTTINVRNHTSMNIPDYLQEPLIQQLKQVFFDSEVSVVKSPTFKNPTGLYINIKWD